MIKADGNAVHIKGTGKDLIVDFMMITQALVDECKAPKCVLKDCFLSILDDEEICDVDKSRERIKEILKSAGGQAIMQDLVNIMREVVEKDD